MLGEHAAPVVNRAKRLRIRAVERPPAVAPRGHQADIPQHLEVLGHRRLLELERVGDLPHRPFLGGNELEDVSAARFGYGVERIRRRRCARHGPTYIFRYGNVSSGAMRAVEWLR